MDDLEIERSQDQGTGRRTLKVRGGLTIEEAARFKEALLWGVSEARELELDLTGATALDLSALQLICACRQTAERQGKRFLLSPGGSGLFERAATEAGLQRQAGNDGETKIIA